MDLKRCSKCKIEKKLEQFYNCRTRKFAYCKDCAAEYRKAYYTKNIEHLREVALQKYYKKRRKILANQRKWYKKNKEKAIASRQKYLSENREKYLEYHKKYYIEHKAIKQEYYKKYRFLRRIKKQKC